MIPMQINLLQSLTKLTVTSNRLDTIPSAILQLKELQELTLSSNAITVIPDDIELMTGLKELSIDKNLLESIPVALSRCPNLEWIDMENNPIKYIPDELLSKEDLNLLIFFFEAMQEVIPGLYISSHSFEKRMKDQLKEKGITHILFILSKQLPSHPEDFIYKTVDIEDHVQQKISNFFDETIQFIKQGMESGRVLVNCECGVSRSATIVLSFLMDTLDLTYEQAFLLLRRKRPSVKPNEGFKKQLIEWYNAKRLTN